MKKWTYLCLAILLTLAFVAQAEEQADRTWTGEVVDLACYVAQGDKGKGPDHEGCAKGCVKAGQPMGLLTDDGTLILLAASHKDGKPYEALKDLAGGMAAVTGSLAERDGMKIVTVNGSKAAG